MNETYNSINPVKTNQFIITWDTGKRCNFDCAYCGEDRHDLVSPFPSFDELIKGVDLVKDYLKVIMPFRNEKTASLSLTGGEPTANPCFIEFSQYLKDSFKDFEYDVYTILTTNGSFHQKHIPLLAKNFRGITLSYHCDSKEKIKEKVRENIVLLKQEMKSFKVNLMMHPYDKYWQECLDLIDLMDLHNVKYMPRVINGMTYSDEQSSWIKNYWQNKNSKGSKTKIADTYKAPEKDLDPQRKMKKDVGETVKKLRADKTKTNVIEGRHCCSNHELSCGLQCGTTENQKYVADTRFKNWYCGVNWFFLHLESQTDQIFHHQTCQAKFGQQRGAVGTITNYKEFTTEVEKMLESGSLEPIICPNMVCRCGLCATKSNDADNFKSLMANHITGVEYAL